MNSENMKKGDSKLLITNLRKMKELEKKNSAFVLSNVNNSFCLSCGDRVNKGNNICSPCYLAGVHK